MKVESEGRRSDRDERARARAAVYLLASGLVVACETVDPRGPTSSTPKRPTTDRLSEKRDERSSLTAAPEGQGDEIAKAQRAASSAPPPNAPPRCVTPLRQPPAPRAEAAERCPPDPGNAPVLPRARVRFSNAPGQPVVSVERALSPAARSRGLMFRTRMPADSGMLFSWNHESVRSFWMRNTCIPLDMLFIAADGTIVGILEQVPTLNTTARSVPCKAQHVLELNAGWARSHGVTPGQRVEIEVGAAHAARE